MRQLACMPIVHAKSPCCQGKIYRFGNRRRQCALCRSTWRIRKKKRGRKCVRVHPSTAARYLGGALPPSSSRTRRGNGSRWRVYHRMGRSRDVLIQRSRWATPLPATPLIAIADAIWQWIGGTRHTLYLILLKPRGSSEAIICPPLLRQGEETIGWKEAFSLLPQEWQERIDALVCDGNAGLVSLAYRRGWLLQRCHVHLRRFLNNYLRTGSQSRARALAADVHRLVSITLVTHDRLTLIRTLLRLREIYHATSSRGVKKVISGFIKHAGEYRTYLDHPAFDLPTTTNAIESLNSLIRALQHRARGFRSPRSFSQWVDALLMQRKTITCNGHLSTKLTR